MTKLLDEGITLYSQKKYSDALQFFKSILPQEASSLSLELAYYIGFCYVRLNQPDEAMSYLEHFVTNSTNEQRVNQCRLVLAVIYSQTGRVSLADFELQKLLENGCQTVNVLSALGYSAWVQEKNSEAAEWYEKALQIDPENPTALNGFGYVLASGGKDLTRALSMCKKALDIIPEYPAYLDSMAWIYYKLGLLKEAKQYIKKAKKKNPGNNEIASHYRVIYEQMNDNRNATGTRAAAGGKN